MSFQSLNLLVDERVAQLEHLAERRNVLLREMYHLMRLRQNIGSVYTLDEDAEGDLGSFLDKFNLSKNPNTGSIVNLQGITGESTTDASIKNDIAHELSAHVILADAPMDTDGDVMLPSPSQSRCLQSKPFEEEGSDDVLALNSSDRRQVWKGSVPPLSRRYAAAADDDDRDELDLIGSLSPPPFPSATSFLRSYPVLQKLNTQTPANRSPVDMESPLPKSQDPVAFPSPPPESFPEIMKDSIEQHNLASQDRQDVITPPTHGGSAVHDLVEVAHTQTSYLTPNIVPDEGDSLTLGYPTNDIPSSPVRYMLLVPFVPSEHEETQVRERQVTIPTPTPTSKVTPFVFENRPVFEAMSSEQHLPSPQSRHQFHSRYSLPPLKGLPTEFNRKGKSIKQRKREKEREKNDKVGDAKKEDWGPMGYTKWSATLRANSVWKKLSRAQKCLSTREWGIAISELRLVRTLDRVESLKDAGRWSFRQPKKQRGVGGLTKTHWDYLMDEMKWMRTDFREERKWRLALAYNLGTAVLEWHAAGTLEERVRLKICVLWKRTRPETELSEHTEDADGMDVDENDQPSGRSQDNPLLMVDYDSDNDDEQDADQDVVDDALESTNAVEDALDRTESDAQESILQPKQEDLDDTAALRDVVALQECSDVVSTQSHQENVKALIALKSASTDPLLGTTSSSTPQSQSVPADSEFAESATKPASKTNIYAPLRQKIAYSDNAQLFLDLHDFDLVEGFADLSTDEKSPEVSLPLPDLSSIFPDLQPYGPLGVTLPISTSSEGKKKSDRKLDKDDPNKRAEDTTYTKLAPVSKFMYCKPTFLGSLNPAKRWKHGHWTNLEDTAVVVDYDGLSNKNGDDILSDLFEGNKPGALPQGSIITSNMPTRRRPELVWTISEDLLLKSLIDRYPNNWLLIADSFNSSRVTIATDKRTPSDCQERWSARWALSSKSATQAVRSGSPNMTDGSTPPPTTVQQTQMTTRGVKRLASSSVSGPTAGLSSSNDSKKRRRHNLMYDTIRKAAKKKEAAQKASLSQRKPSAIHDTHGQYNKMPKLTPAELSRMKAEKEARDNIELIQARRRHEELARQQLMREGRQVVPSMPQTAPLLQPTNGTVRPPGTSLASAQTVPQIRSQVNISQQQRIPTPLTAASARMSPQQIMQVQAQAVQARAMAAAAQAQAVASNANGMVANGANSAHISPPYTSRASTSSPSIPQGSPPNNSLPTANPINPPRPPSASQTPIQQQAIAQVAQQVPGNTLPRPAANMGHYFPVMSNIPGGQITQEQMEQALHLQSLLQAQQFGMAQAQQNGTYPAP